MSTPVSPDQIEIPVNDGPSVLDRAGLSEKIIEFRCNGFYTAGRVKKIARNYGVTQLLIERSNEERQWYDLSLMKNINLV